MVSAPASTGKASRRRAVTRIAQTNSGIRCIVMPGAHVEDRDDEVDGAEDRRGACDMQRECRSRRTGLDDRRSMRAAGRPSSQSQALPTKAASTSNTSAGASSQKLMLFMRGNAMSGAPIIRHEPVAEATDHRRHHHEEHHQKAVRGHQHVVELRVGDVLQSGLRQLQPDVPGHRAADQRRDHRQDEVHRADVFMIGGIEPASSIPSDGARVRRERRRRARSSP